MVPGRVLHDDAGSTDEPVVPWQSHDPGAGEAAAVPETMPGATPMAAAIPTTAASLRTIMRVVPSDGTMLSA
jgi:hypothetical protein